MKSNVFNSNFIFLILGQTFSLFGAMVLKFTISLLILDLTGSAAMFGGITAISYLPPIFLAPFGGILADRLNKRNLMVGMDCLYAVAAVVLALSLSAGPVLIPITVVMLALSVVSSFETPVVQSSIPLIQNNDALISSNAVVNQVNMVSNLLGPLAAGALYGSGARIIFFSCAVLFLAAALLEMFIKISKTQMQEVKNVIHVIKQDLYDGVLFITKEKPYVCSAILLNAAFVLLIQPLITIGAPFIIRVVLGLSSLLNGASQAAMGVAGLAGGLLAGLIASKFKTSKIYQLFWIMGVSMACFGISFLFHIPAVVSYAILVICGVVIFMSASIAGIYIMSAIQRNVPDNMLGRVMSFYSALLSAALPIGLLIYGYLYERFVDYLPVVMGVTAAFILLIGHIGKATYRHL